MQEGYSVCLNEWALDNDIKNELRLLLIISSLSAEKGYCFASNKYFADLFGETERSISKKIKKLEDKNIIYIKYQKRGAEVISREIYFTRWKNISLDDGKIFRSTMEKNFKDNNTSINNTSINNIYKRFKKPTISEIKEYCKERNNNIDAENFYNYYESVGWKVGGRSPMKDWKACVRTWEKKNQKQEGQTPSWFGKEIKAERSNVEVTEEELRYVGVIK